MQHAIPNVPNANQRLAQIRQARQTVMVENQPLSGHATEAWIAQSWHRCLGMGYQPGNAPGFDLIPGQALRRIEEANHSLLEAAEPIMNQLGRAVAGTRYFAILTNADGVVVNVNGPIDRADRRADVISRIGVDLSEGKVGTTAIGAALTELKPVWLHRGEHFFDVNCAYSCAGAPLFGPDGQCEGMLDLTGIDAEERPELMHLAAHFARNIENALTLRRPHELILRVNWHGHTLDEDTDGLLCLDAEGWVTGANSAARQMIPQLAASRVARMHASELFAASFELLFDHAQPGGSGPRAPIEIPLWSGLRLQARSSSVNRDFDVSGKVGNVSPALPLKDLETALIRQAVAQAKGNVMQAAQALGISRATVYRKLGTKKKRP